MGEVCAFLASQKLKFHSNQRWISTASADFIFPSAPRSGFRRDERLRGRYRPSTGLRPLNVSRVKCGGGPCRGHAVLPCTGNTICLQGVLMKELRKVWYQSTGNT